jgi:hypothetical protein
MNYKIKTKKIFLLAIVSLALVSKSTNAQVGIGTNAPNTSSILDVSASNKGVLLPRVSLSSETDAATIATPAKGLTVYNTNVTMTNGNGEGIYMNVGTSASPKWAKLQTQTKTSGAEVAKMVYRSLVQGGIADSIITIGRFQFRMANPNQTSNPNGGNNRAYPQFRFAANPSSSVTVSALEEQSYSTNHYAFNDDQVTVSASNWNVWQDFPSMNDGLNYQERNKVYLSYPGDNDFYIVEFFWIDAVSGSLSNDTYAIIATKY